MSAKFAELTSLYNGTAAYIDACEKRIGAAINQLAAHIGSPNNNDGSNPDLFQFSPLHDIPDGERIVNSALKTAFRAADRTVRARVHMTLKTEDRDSVFGFDVSAKAANGAWYVTFADVMASSEFVGMYIANEDLEKWFLVIKRDVSKRYPVPAVSP